LNHTAVIAPLSSATRALRIVSRRRARRAETLWTSPAIDASSSPKRSAIRRSPTGRW
jgi:hypothetical protein